MADHGSQAIPRHADTIVVGGGTAGAVVAARLAAGSDRSVLLLEAGPDYGPFAAGRWPPALLDPTVMPITDHTWGYISAAKHGARELALERARVIGGCSAHNGCAAVWGHRDDYDAWERAGNPGWGAAALLPLFRAGSARLAVHTPTREEITPWHRACLDAGPGAGFPIVDELNDLDQELGIAVGPVNIRDGVRWNTAFAYLDPVRDRANLTICGNVLADRLVLERGRAAGLDVIGPDGPARVAAERVVLAGGAYGSPLLLLRSGIGPPEELRALGIGPVHALPGVGRNLQDHPAVQVRFSGTPELVAAMDAFVAGGGSPREEGTIVNARSSRCEHFFDLHLYPLGTRPTGYHPGARNLDRDSWRFGIAAAVMTPRSRGSVRPAGPDPATPPLIDHAYLTDDEDHDLAVLLDGIDLIRTLAAQPPLAGLIGEESNPGSHLVALAELRAHVRAASVHDYHPVGTCKMGPAIDRTAVVDARGKLHGLAGLFVADASIMPIVPRANTNLPALVVGEKIAALLLADEAAGT